MWPRGRDCRDATISQRVPKPLEAGGTKHPFTPKPEEGARFWPSNANFGLWNLKSVSEYISFILGFPFHGKLLQQHQERIQVPVGLGLLLFEPALHHAPWLFFFKKNFNWLFFKDHYWATSREYCFQRMQKSKTSSFPLSCCLPASFLREPQTQI